MRANQLFYLVAFACGLLFALALGLSGMMDPRKVQGFLDLTGRWDPSLMLVMGGAVSVTLSSSVLILKRKQPLLEQQFYLPSATQADAKLIGGSVLFGAGWAISGLCPGPALANLASLNTGVLLFVGSMFSGFGIYEYSKRMGVDKGLKKAL